MTLTRSVKLISWRLKYALNERVDMLFPNPLAVRLLNALGASTVTIGRVRKGHKPMTIVLSKGRLLASENFKLDTLNGQVCLINDVRFVIGVESDDYHSDIVLGQQLDDWLADHNYHALWIPKRWIQGDPSRVRQFVAQYI